MSRKQFSSRNTCSFDHLMGSEFFRLFFGGGGGGRLSGFKKVDSYRETTQPRSQGLSSSRPQEKDFLGPLFKKLGNHSSFYE